MLAAADVRTVVHQQIQDLMIEAHIEVTPLTGQELLHELGVNSLMLARLIIQLEAELGIDPFAKDVVISDVRSVNDMVNAYEGTSAADPEAVVDWSQLLNGAVASPDSGAESMSHDALVVVGDRFESFLANHGTISISALLQQLRTGDTPSQLSILVGQGLTADQLATLQQVVGRAGAGVSFADELPAYAERGLTHKRDPKNVMIGTPVRISEDRFLADLVIDQHTETLEDHLTGQHIPAITLMEAARQTWTAVTEKFLIDGTSKNRFVIHGMRSTFHRLVFPLPATVQYQLLSRDEQPVGPMFDCVIKIYQGDTVSAEIEASFQVIPEAFIDKQELLAGRQAVLEHLAGLEHAAGSVASAKTA
jgi:acyl carrier protein